LKAENITVNSFNFSPGYKGSEVKALVQIKLEGASKDHFTHIDLTGDEVKKIIEIARSVERRLMGNSVSSETKLQTQQIETLHQQLAQRYNNLWKLQEQATIHPAGEIPIELHNRIANENRAIVELEDEIASLKDSGQ
jgi:hypothetical protein